MNVRRTLFLLLVLALIWLLRPSSMWNESKRMWAQRELLLRVLVVIIVLYFGYGLYELYRTGWFAPWLGEP
jgi:hypothetical protein